MIKIAKYRARYYNPTLGRFISRDPLSGAEFSQGTNLYAYCQNNYINCTDATGKCFKLSLSLAASLSSLNNALNPAWEAVGNAIPGSGLSTAADLTLRAAATNAYVDGQIAAGLPAESQIALSLEGSAEGMTANAALASEASYTASGAVSGYGAFGVTGAEGMSATGVAGLVTADAVGCYALGAYGVDSITPPGFSESLGSAIGNGWSVVLQPLYSH